MAITRIIRAGAGGVNKDISPVELPVGDAAEFTWSNAENMRFLDGYAAQFYGYGAVYESPSITPYFLLPLVIETTPYWVYAGAASIYGVALTGAGVTHTELSPTPLVMLDDLVMDDDLVMASSYTGSPNSWTGGVLGGIPILNNGTDDPQQWSTDITSDFEDLSNWPAATTCKSMRVYKQFLVAMNVTVSGTNYPYMVKWSHPAVPGAVPTSWDHTDETVDAGQTDLAEGSGIIIDGLPLRDSFIIYREGSIWIMNYIGGPFVFSFKKMLGTSGIMNRNCVVEFDGYHFVLTDNDMLVHDGNTAVPILDKQVRRDVFRDIDSDARNVCFVMKNPFFNEIWVGYPSVGKTSCDKAVVWNYRDKTVSLKALPDIYHGAYGQVDEATTDPWSDDTETWAEDTTRWNEAANVPGNIRSLMASANDELYMLDAGGEDTDSSSSFPYILPFTLGGSTGFSSYLERAGLIFGAAERRTLIKGIRPRITGTEGSTIRISVGGTDDNAYATPTYDSTVEYVIGTDLRADMLVDRRYMAIKLENDASAYEWQLDSFDIEWEDGGIW